MNYTKDELIIGMIATGLILFVAVIAMNWNEIITLFATEGLVG